MEKITVVTRWCNEELLAPLFLRHYSYVDEIRILLETDTKDNTRDICYACPNVTIIPVHSPSGYDEIENIGQLNYEILTIEEGWIYAALADEFIFPQGFEDPQTFLGRQVADVVRAKLYHVYKHVSEGPIDYEGEVIPQRVHGKSRREVHHFITKPIVFRAKVGMQLGPGLHKALRNFTYSNELYVGAHWKMADREIAVRRRLAARDTFSERNKQKGYGRHDFDITEEKILSKLKEYENLPVIPDLVDRR